MSEIWMPLECRFVFIILYTLDGLSLDYLNMIRYTLVSFSLTLPSARESEVMNTLIKRHCSRHTLFLIHI